MARRDRYRARPRLRRRRSAGLSFRGFVFDFEPERVAPASASAVRWRTGARLRASRQMNSEMPPRTTIAPIAIAIAPVPLRLLEPAVVVVGGFYDSGLPFGLEFSGRPFKDGDLLGYAYAWEQATHHRHPPTLVEGGLLPDAR